MKNEDFSNLTPESFDNPENDKQIQHIVSNPIHIYKIIKYMLWFIDESNTDVYILLSLPNSGMHLGFHLIKLIQHHSSRNFHPYLKHFLHFHCLSEENPIRSVVKKHMSEGMEFPGKNDLSGATFSLWILPLMYRFHPIELVDGNIGGIQTNAKLNFDDIIHVSDECIQSRKSLFLDTKRSYFKNVKSNNLNYAVAIEWIEAAEM